MVGVLPKLLCGEGICNKRRTWDWIWSDENSNYGSRFWNLRIRDRRVRNGLGLKKQFLRERNRLQAPAVGQNDAVLADCRWSEGMQGGLGFCFFFYLPAVVQNGVVSPTARLQASLRLQAIRAQFLQHHSVHVRYWEDNGCVFTTVSGTSHSLVGFHSIWEFFPPLQICDLVIGI